MTILPRKRNYSCQFCSFNATYQEIVDDHLPKYSYVLLQCLNMCQVSCEREMMDDHIKTCRLDRVACQFSAMGCLKEFKREDQEAHISENAQILYRATSFKTRSAQCGRSLKISKETQRPSLDSGSMSRN